MTAPRDELVEVVDEDGRVVRVCHRAEMRAANLRHRSVAVVVVTSAGELVVHRRAGWKDVWPGRWDVCFGGVVGAGESWRAAAVRELAEEAGVIVRPSSLRFLGQGAYADADVSAVSRVYLVADDGPFTPADGEVAELGLVPLGRLAAWLAGRPLCPDSRVLIVPLVQALVRGDAPRVVGVPGG